MFGCLCLNLGYIFEKKSGNKRKQERIRKTVPDSAPLYRGMRRGNLRLLMNKADNFATLSEVGLFVQCYG